MNFNLVDVQEADSMSTPDMDETISYDDTDSDDTLLCMIVNLIVNVAVIMDIKFIFNIQNVKYDNFSMYCNLLKK